MHHMYYNNAATLDLSKFRKECEDRQRGDYYAKPSPSIIHYHPADAPCEGRGHEEFPVEDGTASA
jgi:hypothetical protein